MLEFVIQKIFQQISRSVPRHDGIVLQLLLLTARRYEQRLPRKGLLKVYYISQQYLALLS